MRSVWVESFEWGSETAEKLEKRLEQTEGGGSVGLRFEGSSRTAVLTAADAAGEAAIADALARLLVFDAAGAYLAVLIENTALSPGEKRRVLAAALRGAREELGRDGIKALSLQLREYISHYERLNVEGFLLFRMQGYVRALGRHAGKALALSGEGRSESKEGFLRMLLTAQQPRLASLSLILRADGTCIIADDTDSRIECENCCGVRGAERELVSLLVSLLPEHLAVYDLSLGRGEHLLASIRAVFGERVRFFR